MLRAVKHPMPLAASSPHPGSTQQLPQWHILVIDDDPEVHASIRAALEGAALFGRSLAIAHARPDAEIRPLLLRKPDWALVMLAIEADGVDRGLGLMPFIRHAAGMRSTQIVLRTSQPGHVPDLSALLQYDVHDYRTKSELTQDRWLALVAKALHSYQQHCAIEASRRSLELIARSSAVLLQETALSAFASTVVAQLATLLDMPNAGIFCTRDTARQHPDSCHVLAATGRFAEFTASSAFPLGESRLPQLLHRALQSRTHVYGEEIGLALYIGHLGEQDVAVYIDAPGLQPYARRQLLEVFCTNLHTLLHNRGLLERLHRSAYYDPLVQLPNRARFIEKVDECVRSATHDQMLALVDIDDFSTTNDVMGHRFGDRLLDAVARCLSSTLPTSALLARVGGDTFGILGTAQEIQPHRLLECVRQPLTIDGAPHKVSLTCGYVLLSGDRPGDDLVKDATIALKRAKRDHRGQHLQYSAQMGAEARSRAALLTELRAAIESNELFLVYQPQIRLDSGTLTGLEALLRWRRRDGRLVQPDQFIPMAEHSGLIVALGQWVLSMACQTMRTLLDTGLAPPRMAINVSMVQLRDPGFLESVHGALSNHGLHGHHLELEITESVAVLPTQLLESTLIALRAQGITIAIDDFGTGYSSLSYLERLPLDRIKIDRTFVRKLGEPQSARIAEMVVQLGRKLGLQVLA
ncbi:MAG: EAL domain-containing protein, partial [Burkholderiaceae bacterium]